LDSDEVSMNDTSVKKLNTEIVEERDEGFIYLIQLKHAFEKLWKDMEPRHKWMILTGLVLTLIGILDFALYLIFDYQSWVFWPNDLLLIFGGCVLIQIGLRYALRSSDE
jgi:hypothetical protein